MRWISKRVIDGSPWAYDGTQLIIERLQVGGDPKALALNTLDIWIEIHDVRPWCMRRPRLGCWQCHWEIIESDPKNFYWSLARLSWDHGLLLTSTKPLRRRFKVTKGGMAMVLGGLGPSRNVRVHESLLLSKRMLGGENLGRWIRRGYGGVLQCGKKCSSNPDGTVTAAYLMNVFLIESLGNNPSYIWRSVLESQALVRAGARRSVGSGSQVNILHDPWLVDDANPYVESRQDCLVGKMVNALMKVGVREWDDEVLKDVLIEKDQEKVWKIPLIDGRSDDWYWRKEALGVFSDSKCICYIAARKNQQLATKMLKAGWVPSVATAAMTFCSWWEEGLGVWNMAECLEAGMILWSIWRVRNEVVWNAKHLSIDEVLLLAKLNFDDCFGIGLVARSAAGTVIQAKSFKKVGAFQPHEVEAIGIKEALSWIKNNNWSGVIVESNCQRVVLDLQNFGLGMKRRRCNVFSIRIRKGRTEKSPRNKTSISAPLMAIARTGVYVDDYLEYASTLPAELQRLLNTVRELDDRSHYDDATIEKMRKDIELNQDNALNLCTEKVLLAQQAYDLIDSHVKRLDEDLTHFAEDLKQERDWDRDRDRDFELMPPPGSHKKDLPLLLMQSNPLILMNLLTVFAIRF
uniref:Inhibitor of growth protein N-terminal histone-binding domain-containing protein n=1 Tax=Cannabis sativa TaxID=3483 RepID=A0A803Q3T1_CANSA